MEGLLTDGSSCSFSLRKQHAGLANSIRRALMNDVKTWAPCLVTVAINTTCQTDEYIAHRIGLIPFVATAEVGVPPRMQLHVSDRTALASDLTGECGLKPPHDVPILTLTTGQELQLEVEFEYSSAATHARFSHVGPVSYKVDDSGTAHVSFETTSNEPAVDHLVAALASLVSRASAATHFVETQYDGEHSIV